MSAAASPAQSRSEKVRPDPVADVGGRRAIPLVPPFGFGQSPVGGCRSYWNYLDFVVVILNLFDPLLPNNTQVITCLRIGRCLRPLRLLVRPARTRTPSPARPCVCVRATHRLQTNTHARAQTNTQTRAQTNARARKQTHARARAGARQADGARVPVGAQGAAQGRQHAAGREPSPFALPPGRPACARSTRMPASPASVRRARALVGCSSARSALSSSRSSARRCSRARPFLRPPQPIPACCLVPVGVLEFSGIRIHPSLAVFLRLRPTRPAHIAAIALRHDWAHPRPHLHRDRAHRFRASAPGRRLPRLRTALRARCGRPCARPPAQAAARTQAARARASGPRSSPPA
jgi:hypothetical protein